MSRVDDSHDPHEPHDEPHDDELPDSGRPWRRARGVFVLAELSGPAADRIRALQLQWDPKLAAQQSPHVTLIGSSGAGPIVPGTTEAALRAAIEPIARSTAPLVLPLEPAHRYMQTEIVVLPMSVNGPLRALHERIRTSGLRFLPARFAFSPHATLSFYPTLTRPAARALLQVRVREPVTIERLSFSLTNDPQPPTRLFELALGG